MTGLPIVVNMSFKLCATYFVVMALKRKKSLSDGLDKPSHNRTRDWVATAYDLDYLST
jgi:hypothetical protein